MENKAKILSNVENPKYVIAVGNDIFELEEEVNEYLNKGFVPQGGVSVAIENYQSFRDDVVSSLSNTITKQYIQAMVKTKD